MSVLPPDFVELALTRLPLPIAESVGRLEAARSPHEQRDRVVEVFRATVRVLGGLALAARLEAGSGPDAAASRADERIARLARQALTDGEWVGLTRDLLRPWRRTPTAHPLPLLVELVAGAKGLHEELDELLGMRKSETVAHGTTGDAEEVAEILRVRGPQLHELLLSLGPLWEGIRIVVALDRPSDESKERQRAWLLHGRSCARSSWRVVDLAQGVRVPAGSALIVDRAGQARLKLDPIVILERSTPDATEDLFFFDGRDKRAGRYLALPSNAEVHRVDVLETIDRALAPPITASAETASVRPFRGLASFEAAHASLFVGREALVESLANRIAETAWVTVTGASGSGKSSLLAAGVGPALRARRDRRGGIAYRDDGGSCVVVLLRPGHDPLASFARALNESLGGLDLDDEPPDSWPGRILAYVDARRTWLILVVDQAEELVTLAHDEVRRNAFGALLAGLTATDGGPVRVVLSVRGDWLTALSSVPSIRPRYLRVPPEVVTTPGVDDLVRILEEPVARCGGRWADGLPRRIAEAVAREPAGLALLSFVADALWTRRGPDGLLSEEAYEELGRVEGALATAADATIAKLDSGARAAAREVLLRLVTPEETRDVVSRTTLEEAGGRRAAEVVDALVAARLLTTYEGADGAAMVELAHEALFRHWPLLRGWRDEDREATAHFARLRAATATWINKGKPRDAFLWDEASIGEHDATMKRSPHGLAVVENEFVSASRGAARRRRRAAVVAVAAVVVFLCALSGWALFERSRAAEETLAAEAARDRAELGERRARITGLLGQAHARDAARRRDEAFALILAARNLDPEIGPAMTERDYLEHALLPTVSPVVMNVPGLRDMRFDATGELVTVGPAGVQTWSRTEGLRTTQPLELPAESEVHLVAQGTVLIMRTQSEVSGRSAATGELLWRLETPTFTWIVTSPSDDDHLLIISNRTVTEVDPRTGVLGRRVEAAGMVREVASIASESRWVTCISDPDYPTPEAPDASTFAGRLEIWEAHSQTMDLAGTMVQTTGSRIVCPSALIQAMALYGRLVHVGGYLSSAMARVVGDSALEQFGRGTQWANASLRWSDEGQTRIRIFDGPEYGPDLFTLDRSAASRVDRVIASIDGSTVAAMISGTIWWWDTSRRPLDSTCASAPDEGVRELAALLERCDAWSSAQADDDTEVRVRARCAGGSEILVVRGHGEHAIVLADRLASFGIAPGHRAVYLIGEHGSIERLDLDSYMRSWVRDGAAGSVEGAMLAADRILLRLAMTDGPQGYALVALPSGAQVLGGAGDARLRGDGRYLDVGGQGCLALPETAELAFRGSLRVCADGRVLPVPDATDRFEATSEECDNRAVRDVPPVTDDASELLRRQPP